MALPTFTRLNNRFMLRGMKPLWNENLILVCEKCGSKLAASSATPNPSHDLKNWLKKELIARKHWGETRVVTSSCLDICPKEKVAIAFMSNRIEFPADAEIIDPVLERERILDKIVSRAPRPLSDP
jgi:hypothetical protein